MIDIVNIEDIQEVLFSTRSIKNIRGEYSYSIWDIVLKDYRGNEFSYYAFSSDKSLTEFKEDVVKEIEEDFNRNVALEVALVLGGQR